ncbi:MAG: hypothetical protein MUO31_09950 [Thermodesulfovibrionales bacterium]|nr:hypothetical protein [Thermodesulfovibrionales bacterium]
MSGELKDSGTVTALSVVGFVFGLIGMLGSFIPCIGSLAFYISIPSSLISGIALIIANNQKTKKTFAIVALTIGLIGTVISGFQYFSIVSAGESAKKELQKMMDANDIQRGISIKAKENRSKEAIDELQPTEKIFKTENISDGYLNHPYNCFIKPVNGTLQSKISIDSNTLPPGLIFNSQTNTLEGIPVQKGVWELDFKISDAKESQGKLLGVIKIYRILSVGTDGEFSGKDGMQMALNSAEDMDAICIEEGEYKLNKIEIIESKSWEHGIKISGGWDSSFTQAGQLRNTNTELTVPISADETKYFFRIQSIKGEIQIENILIQNTKGGGILVQRKETEMVVFSNCSFFNNNTGYDGFISGGSKIFLNCTFENNSNAVKDGGTFKNCAFNSNSDTVINGGGSFSNCSFKNNSGVCVHGNGEFIDCTFSENNGQANFGGGYFLNCLFDHNSTKSSYRYRGGIIFVGSSSNFNSCIFKNNYSDSGVVTLSYDATFKTCRFENNTSAGDGGAVGAEYTGVGYFEDCIFENNSALGSGGAVNGGESANYFTNCLFKNNSAGQHGGAISLKKEALGEYFVIGCTFYENKSKEGGGAFYGSGKIINSIFWKNIDRNEANDIAAGDKLEIDYSLLNTLVGPANFGSHNIKGDPKIANPQSGNFQLQSDSPCVNTGTIISDRIVSINQSYGREFQMKVKIPLNDLSGQSRIVNEKIDLGAYEYQADNKINEMLGSEINQSSIEKSSSPEPAKSSLSTIYEAENAIITGSAKVNTEHDGFSGTGYIDGYGYMALVPTTTFTVQIPADGIYEVTLRYAKARGSSTRNIWSKNPRSSEMTVSIYVNGAKIKRTILASPDNWDKWANKTELIAFKSGQNLIAYKYDDGDSGNINIDYIRISK